MKAAHQALILDGNGTISVQPNASAIVLSKTYIELLARRENSANVSAPNAELEEYTATLDVPGEESGEQLRQQGVFSLYRYFTRPTSSWKICLWLLSMALLVATERSPGKSLVSRLGAFLSQS